MSHLSPQTPHRRSRGHSRSISNPFSGIGKRRKSPSRHDFLDSDDDDDEVTFPLPEVSTSVSPKKPLPPLPDDMLTGRCMTCSAAVKWPANLKVFRCTQCLAVNDLEPAKSKETGKEGLPTIPRKAVPVSVEHTRVIAERCVAAYLRKVLEDPRRLLLVPTGPVRDYSTSNPEPREQVTRPSIFKPLEEYIISSFKGCDCLNNSFTTVPSASNRSPSRVKPDSTPLPPLPSFANSGVESDAKTLLLGDLAANSSWWTGDGRNANLGRPCEEPDRPTPTSRPVTSRTPRIDWLALAQWYQLILMAGTTWVEQWSAMRPTDIVDTADDWRAKNWDSADMSIMEKEITEARLHLHRTLLKATENLLKRPRRPIRKPEETRFLLILLANPLIYPSSALSKAQAAATSAREPRMPSATRDITKLSPQDVKAPRKEPPKPPGSRLPPRGPGQHSGIVKRIVGIVANLPDDCHHVLVSWFSRYTPGHFERIVDLIGSFITYRMTRQHGRKRSESAKNDDSLIPTFSSPSGNTPAEMHAALNGRQSAKKAADKRAMPMAYGDDWQIHAAARTMAVLFTANTANLVRKHESLGRLCIRRGHIVPISSFYNMLLDYSDLVADFEAWEMRSGKFTFCQYPFFLSIWAKIHILEYDARRQMETKARDAFFNSILNHKAVSQYLVLKIRRECLVEDSLRGVSEVVGSGPEEIKKGLRIEFVGEEGIDAGGIRKEWFLLLVREIFYPHHGLFVYDDESHYCYFNPHCFESSEQFFLVGVLLGLAIYNSTILDIALPPFAFKKLMTGAFQPSTPQTSVSRPVYKCTVEDLAEYRPGLAKGLQQLLEFDGDVAETFCYDFVAQVERYGEMLEVPLCPGGEKRPVTNANRREFVDLYVNYLLDTSVTRQFEPFRRGFFSVCGGNALSLFRPEEIELLVRGSDEPLDVASLRAVATYDNWGVRNPASVPVVRWFWNFFEEAEPKAQRKILSFITGGDRIPAMGATSLNIRLAYLGDDPTRYPTARTCFNTLGLYRYPTKDMLEHMLWEAVVNSEGFGLK